MRITTDYCDLCSQEIAKNKVFCIEVKWINGNEHRLDICEKCRDEVGYKFNSDNKSFFAEVLRKFRK